jgi:autotransporter-associated beta strand protein
MGGASLTIIGGNLGAGTVAGGARGIGAGNGQAFGGGLFLQGNETITLALPSGTTETISGVIADQTGSGGTGANAGAGGLILNGAGTLDLAAVNTFTGGVTIKQGELELATSAAAGTGNITFATGAGATATLGLMSGNALGATISGFGSGDKVDFDAVGYASTDTVAYANGIVSIENSTGATVASFDVTPGTYNFKLSADSDPSGNLLVSYAAPSIATAFDLAAAASIAGIPEPSSWAMMLLGFGGLGYAGMRRSFGLAQGRIGAAI